MVLHNPPETFLTCMILDGVFETFPRLRGGCIEQGAMWVVPWLRRLDIAQRTFRRTEPALALSMRASEYVRRQLRFTPFATEPVGWMIEQAGEELFLLVIREFDQSYLPTILEHVDDLSLASAHGIDPARPEIRRWIAAAALDGSELRVMP